MIRRRPYLLVLPVTFVLGHTVTYRLFHAGVPGDGHGYLPLLAVAGVVLFVRFLMRAARKCGDGSIDLRLAPLVQFALIVFWGVEVTERLAHGAGLAASLTDPVLGVGLVVQFVMAWVVWLSARVTVALVRPSAGTPAVVFGTAVVVAPGGARGHALAGLRLVGSTRWRGPPLPV